MEQYIEINTANQIALIYQRRFLRYLQDAEVFLALLTVLTKRGKHHGR
jgi:hypothetical protein